MNLLKLSWKNLIHRPTHTLLSIVLCALGAGLIALLLLLNRQIEGQFEKNLADIDLVIGAKGSPLQLILCGMYHIDNPTGNVPVKDAKPFLQPNHPLIKTAVPLSLGDNYKGFRIVGTTRLLPDSIYRTPLAEGKYWQADLECNIGADVAANAGLKIGDTFSGAHGLAEEGETHEHSDYKVVGIFKRGGTVLDQLILTSTQSVWSVHDHDTAMPEMPADTAPATTATDAHDHEDHDHDHADHDHADHDHDHGDHDHADHAHEAPAATGAGNPQDEIAALLAETDSTKEITSMLVRFRNKTNFRSLNMARNINENTNLQAANPAIEMARLYSTLGNVEGLLRALALLIVGVSALSVFISLYNSLKDRKYELSLMRVMGASRGKLLVLILLEGMLLSLIGTVLGLVLAHGGMELVADWLRSGYRYDFTGKIWLTEEWWLLVAGAGLGLLAAILPAFQAWRTDIQATLTAD